MEYTIQQVFSNGSYLLLAGLVAAALFFAMAGLRELQSIALEGLLYLALAFFFIIVHLYLLSNLPPGGILGLLVAKMNLWTWLTLLYAPSLILMFIVMGCFAFATEKYSPGLVRIFFGLTLLCYLYMVGSSWPADVKGILTLIYGLIWFNLELRTV